MNQDVIRSFVENGLPKNVWISGLLGAFWNSELFWAHRHDPLILNSF